MADGQGRALGFGSIPWCSAYNTYRACRGTINNVRHSAMGAFLLQKIAR